MYIKNRNKDVININKLTFKQFDNILRTAIQKAMKPNPIYDDGTIFMGEFKTKEDALLYPIPNNWCTSNSSSKFNQYTQGGYRLFIIENKTLDEPLKYVCASIFMGNVKYWNTEGYRLFEELRGEYNIIDNEHQKYQATLPKEIISYLYNIAASQTEERENKMKTENKKYKMSNNKKKKIRLTESDLHYIIKESVNTILNEGFGSKVVRTPKLTRLLNREGLGDILLCKDYGYFYITSDNEELANKISMLHSNAIYRNSFNQQSPEEWVEDIKYILRDIE